MRRLTVWRRTAFALVAVLAAGTAAASAPLVPAAGAYAYLTPLAIVAQDGDRRVARGDGYFEDAVLRWSNDGRFVFAVSRLVGVTADGTVEEPADISGEGTVGPPDAEIEPEPATEDGTVVAIDTSTGAVQRVPCDCWDVLPVGDGAAVVEVTGRRRLQSLDLAGDRVWREIPAQLPIAEGASVHPAGSDGSTAYFAVPLGEGTAGSLFATDGDTQTRLLTGIDSGYPQFAAPLDGNQPALLALTHHDRGSCDGADHVSILDSARRMITRTSFLDPAIPATQRRITVLDTWWGRDGSLHAVAAAWACLDDQATTQIVAPSVWRFDPPGWRRTGPAPVLSQRDLPSGAQLVIGVDRRLFLHRGRDPRQVADDVSQIAARPVVEGRPQT